MTLFSKNELKILSILAFVQFTHIVDFMMIMPLGPQLMKAFGISPSQFGLLVGSYTFSAGISGFIGAFWLDRFDRKRALQFLYLGFSVGTISCAFASDFYWLLAARSLTGLFGGVVTSLVMTIVADQIEAHRRATAMSIVMMAFAVASVFGVPFGIWLGAERGWHAPFVFLGSISLVVTSTMAWGLPRMANHLNKHAPISPFVILKDSLLESNQRNSLLFIFFLVMGQFTVIPYLSPSMVANVGFTDRDLTWIYAVGGALSMFSSPMIGRLADKKGKRLVFYISTALSIIPIILITNLTQTPIPVVLIISSSFFILMGGRSIPSQAYISSIVPDYRRASFMSLTNSTQQLSAAMAAALAGTIVYSDAQGHLLNYGKVGWIAVASSILSIVLMTQIKPKELK